MKLGICPLHLVNLFALWYKLCNSYVCGPFFGFHAVSFSMETGERPHRSTGSFAPAFQATAFL
ncbi:hypothetical protein [Polaromonas sp.]|uniref:hypothetical protein n=1 Tax=Polaromonas sp. TaxID=1869339 RepID=UPI0017AE1FC0|nr:hypothetical protein [Polaromonas sp.]NMM06830.1 hypothetical protein [Polaromonas sp.]